MCRLVRSGIGEKIFAFFCYFLALQVKIWSWKVGGGTGVCSLSVSVESAKHVM